MSCILTRYVGAITFAFLVSASCVSQAKRDIAQAPSSTSENLTFASLLETSKSLPSIEDVLPILTQRYGSYFRHHTWMYNSFSLHETTFLEPRAIVYGPDARFVLTFNGGAHKGGGYAFETMEFDEQAGQFLFREVAFKKQMTKTELDELEADEIAFENEFVRVSKPNIAKCTRCHGPQAMPIWETYFLWPGAYGSDDDILTTIFNRYEVNRNGNFNGFGIRNKFGISLGRVIALKPGAKDVEFDGFVDFMRQRPNHPRYKHIPYRSIDSGFQRLLAGEKIDQIDVSDIIKKEGVVSETYPSDWYRPNLYLLDLLYELAAVKNFKTLTSDGKNSRILYKLFWMENCVAWEPEQSEHDLFKRFRKVLSHMDQKTIQDRAGKWPSFLTSFVREEFAMENDKVARFASLFGRDQMQPNTVEGNGGERSSKFYKKLVGPPPAYADFIYGQESDGIYSEAWRAYVLYGFGFDLREMALNMRRVATFRESGFAPVYRRLHSLTGSDLRSGRFYSIEEKSKVCDQVQQLAQ